MSIDEYITQKKELYTLLFNFLESESESETVVDYSIFKIYLETEVFIHNIKNEFMSLCTLLLKISQNYSIDQNIFGRIEQIISYLGKGMKRYFTNSDFFDFFEKDKRILLYLLSQQLLTIDTSLQKIILTKLDSNGTKYCHFFYPEIKSLVSERLRKKIENELLSIDSQIFENFEEKRKNGQNDSFLCELIRKDSLEEFVTYTNECNVSFSSQIQPSLFETNRFLLKNKSTSLIEYSAFFGSIEIFKYLNKNGVEMSPSLWIYAIHGNSLAIIHLLEENQIKPIDKTYKKCFKESIKCHHNEIANYIKTNFIQNGDDEDVISFSFHYHNYHFFPNDLSQNFTLYYAIKYNYLKIVDFLMKSKDFNCYEPIISNYLLINKILKLPLRIAAEKNNSDIINLLLTKHDEIKEGALKNCLKLKQVSIPSTIKNIGSFAFSGCTSLVTVTIPSSVRTISGCAFDGCTSLEGVIIPESVKMIGNCAFNECKKLTTVIIPSSVNYIGSWSFNGCSVLKEITIPSSVDCIGEAMFSGCLSLVEVVIPPSVTYIGANAFDTCSSLTNISIPPSVTCIGSWAFSSCSSLKKIVIPDSVTKLGESIFYGCSSLNEISIPSSLASDDIGIGLDVEIIKT